MLSTARSDSSASTNSQTSSPDATTEAGDVVREWAQSRDNELREDEQRRWEERRRQAEAQSPLGGAEVATRTRSTSVSPTPAASIVAPGIKTPLDVMRNNAYRMFDGRLAELKRRVSDLEARREQMRAACSGTTRGSSVGGIVDPTNPAVSDELSSLTTTSNIEIDNATTPQCRMSVMDAQGETASIRAALERIEEEGRGTGIYPGVMRDLLAKYGFVR